MKLRRSLYILIILSLSTNTVRSQSIGVSFPDTTIFGPALDSTTLSCWINDVVRNLTNNNLAIDVVRVQNDTATPGWSSSFCFQFCSLSGVDSIRAIMSPNEVVNIAVHFHVSGVPDTGTVLMKFVNVNDTSEVIYQRFYANTNPTTVETVNNSNQGRTTYAPFPIFQNQVFNLNLDGQIFMGETITLEVYDICGRRLSLQSGLHEGSNKLLLNLPPGAYVYMLSSDHSVLDAGHLIVSP